jgi:outer membrane protein assembly factor BamD (BamD/ComL family)
LLFIANEYDYKLFNPDSAYKYYNQITVRFPDSEQAAVAKNRIKYLKNSVSDTSDTVIVNDN